jgi:NAD(P)-dependent dehydrogenase (short-subunit alcohol dehydrogenase family)
MELLDSLHLHYIHSGGARGIGLEVSIALAEAGADVCIFILVQYQVDHPTKSYIRSF